MRSFKVKSAVYFIGPIHDILTNLQRQRWVVVLDLNLSLELVSNCRVFEVSDCSLTAGLNRLTFVDIAILKTIVALQLLWGLWRDHSLSESYFLMVLWASVVSVDTSIRFLWSVILFEVVDCLGYFLVYFVQ